MVVSQIQTRCLSTMSKCCTWRMSASLFRKYSFNRHISVSWRRLFTQLLWISCLSPGLHQAGLASTIAQSIALLPEEIQGMFWANIGLIGGNCKISGFSRRLCVPTASTASMFSDWTIAGMSCDRWRLTTMRSTSTSPKSADWNILI